MTPLLQDLVARQANARPDTTAIVMGDDRLTYAELEEASNRLARTLREAGVERGDRVCLLQEKSTGAIVSMLATLKADSAYVPVDVASPAPRLASIVDSAEPRLVLASSANAELLAETLAAATHTPNVAFVDERPEGCNVEALFTGTDVRRYEPSAVPSRNGPQDAAHVLFTSGSTGTPKGVVITHANVMTFIKWATDYFGTKPGERISGHPPLHFDLSTFDIYGTFLAGAELHLVPASLNLLPHRLAEFIRASELTQWFAVPSIFTLMTRFDVVRENDFPTVERVLWCGEVLPTPILRHWMERVPHATFTNLYGPTEATIASSYYTVPGIPATETESIPIGTPCDGEALYVLDERLSPVEAGEIGDLYIAGCGLSPGYWRDADKTRAAFVERSGPDGPERVYRTGDLARVDENDLVHFLGRADSQIKHRGYRIELGEIETAANTLDSLRECAVVAIETQGFEGTAICCAYALRPGAAATPVDLASQLREVLPSYMIPGRWAELDGLPKNVNGKIDRRALRDRFAAEEERAVCDAPEEAGAISA